MNDRAINKAMNLNANLRFLLARQKINASELSRATAIPKTTISGWMNGAMPKSFTQVKVMANYFSLTLDELIYGDVSQKKLSKVDLKDYADTICAGNYEVYLRPLPRRDR